MNPTIEFDAELKVIILRHFLDATTEIERLKSNPIYKGWEIWVIVKQVLKIKI